jgi:hypothetical protein
MGAEVRDKNTTRQSDESLDLELEALIVAVDQLIHDCPNGPMPPIQPAEVLLNSSTVSTVSTVSKQKQKRPHNPKRFKASVTFVVDSVEHFDVTSRLGIIWDTCATSSVLSPAEVPHDATWLSRANSVMYGMGDGAATVQGEVELLVMFTYGGCRQKIEFLGMVSKHFN